MTWESVRTAPCRGLMKNGCFIFSMLIWPRVIQNDYAISVMVVAGLYATLTLGLGLLLGQAGQISFGHGAFFGLGAYTGAILSTRYGVPPLAAIVVAAVGAGLIAYVVGRPVLRLRFYFLALATMGLGVIFVVIVREVRSISGGTWGMTGIPWMKIGPFEVDDYLKQYYVVWGVVFTMWLFSERALRSRVGRALRALAVSEVAASTLGIRTANWKLRTFVVSGVYAGIGGSLYAFTLTAIHPNDFTITLAILVVIMVMVGGMSNLFGVILGTIMMTWAGRAFGSYQEYSGGIYAVVLILLLIFLPDGIAGGLRPIQIAKLRRLFRTTRKPLSEEYAVLGVQEKAQIDSDQREGAETSLQKASKQNNTPHLFDCQSVSTIDPRKSTLLRVEGLQVDFGGVRALDRVSLIIEEDITAALIGPNGAGKTTLFNVLTGLQNLSAGRVWFGGQEITGWLAPEIARLGVARTFQNLRLFGNMTVLENVMVGRHRHESATYTTAGLGISSIRREEKKSREHSLKVLSLVGIEDRADLAVTSLPYGEQRLVEIARALATEPSLLLLDEPAAGMNVHERERLMEKLARIRSTGVTVVLIGHDMELVMGISNKVSVLNYGRIIAEGTPEQIQLDPAVVSAYLGTRHGRREDIPSIDVKESSEPRGGELPLGHQNKVLMDVQGISTYYGSICAIEDLSLRVVLGDCLAVLGANGAGKTTLLRTISGLIRCQRGRILFEGKEITNLRPSKVAMIGIGHVPEGRHVFPTLSVYDNLLLGALHRRDQKDIRKTSEFVYELFPVLRARSRQLSGTLSGGEQQMLAIGRAIMAKPKLLMIDEPSMGLAPLVVEDIFDALQTLNRQGLTLLMVEQNAEMALSTARHAVVLQTGLIALSGSAVELQRNKKVQDIYLAVKQ